MGTSIRDVMTRDPLTLSAAATIGEAAHAMCDPEVGDVIVTDDYGAPCGMVTDRTSSFAPSPRTRPEVGPPGRHLQPRHHHHRRHRFGEGGRQADADRAIRRLPVVQGDRARRRRLARGSRH